MPPRLLSPLLSSPLSSPPSLLLLSPPGRRSSPWGRLTRRLALLAWPWVLALPADAQTSATEADLKAALTLNFARFVEWPERSFAGHEAPVVFCVFANDGYAAAFAALESRNLQGRPVRVRVQRSGSADEARSCHVLFLGEPDKRRLAPLLRGLAGEPVLTVGDADGFIDAGGAIGIVPGEQRLQFEVNRSALDQAHLKASSQLLKLARAVIAPGGGPGS